LHYFSTVYIFKVPNLFAPDEKQEIADKMRAIDRQRDKHLQTDGSPIALFNMFIGKLGTLAYRSSLNRQYTLLTFSFLLSVATYKNAIIYKYNN